MKCTILFSLLCCLLLAMVPVTLAQAQADMETKIRNAMSAAPPSIADNATISDPYATGPTADNEWQAMDVPHLMMLVPDKKMLEGLSTDPDNGGPWVMWANTPYVHIMAPMPLHMPEEK